MKIALEMLSQLALAGWLGSTWLFALVIAPTAFRVLPSVEIAGAMVGPVLTALNLYGMAAGIALGVIARIQGRSLVLQLLPFAMALLCGVSEFGITAAIGDVLPHEFGPRSGPADAVRFAILHRTSQAIFLCIAIACAVLVVLHVRARSDTSLSHTRDPMQS